MADQIQAAVIPGESLATAGDMSVPPQAILGFDRVDWTSFGSTTLLALAAYLFTLAPNVTLEWSGILSAGAAYAGVPSPGGHPAWTIYSWLFTKLLPFSNIAWRIAVGSAVASALACGLVAMMVSRGGRILFQDTPSLEVQNSREQNYLRGICGCVAGLVLAFSNSVWRKAVVVDIWALSLLLFAGILVMFLRWMLNPKERWFLHAGFFLFGLSLTSSQELIVILPGLVATMMLTVPKVGRDATLFLLPLASVVTSVNQYSVWIAFPAIPNWPLLTAIAAVALACILLVIVTRRAATEWRTMMTSGCCLLLGLAPSFYVPVASMTNPPVNWGFPRIYEGFRHILARGHYENLIPTTDPARLVDQMSRFLELIAKGLGWPHLFLSALPFCFLGKMRRDGRNWILGLTAIWICAAPLLLAELNPSPDPGAWWGAIELYLTASYAVLAVWLGLGLILCGGFFARAGKHGDF